MFPAGQVYTGAWVRGWENRRCAGRACTPLVETDGGRPVQERGEAVPRAGPGRAGEEDADPAHSTARGAAELGEGAEMQ